MVEGRGDEKSSSSFEFGDVFDLNKSSIRKEKEDYSSKGLEFISVLITIIQKIDRAKVKVEQVEEKLGKLGQSFLDILASISSMKVNIESSAARTTYEAKINKVYMLNSNEVSSYQ